MIQRLHLKPAVKSDYGKNKSPSIRRRHHIIAKGYENLEFELATKNDRIAALEAEVARLQKTRKRKAIPNPNKRFILLSEALASNEPIPEDGKPIEAPGVEEEDSEEVIEDEIIVEVDESAEESEAPVHHTRSGRAIRNLRII
jgi:uncharacterized small protein (DUF1192 family)